MNLLDYIDLSLKSQAPGMSKSLSKKTSLGRSALEAYLSENGCDLSRSVFADFFVGFGRFLTDAKGRNYTPGTAREILRTLRKHVRSAIAEGLVPNIDSIPAAMERLDAEAWPGARPDPKKGAWTSRLDLKARESAASLARGLDAWHTRQKMRAGGKPASRGEREEALEKRSAAIYLFCLTACGIEVSDALGIRRDRPGSEAPDSVYVERLGCRLQLSPAAKRLVEIHNQGAECSDHLFSTLDSKRHSGDPAKAARQVEDRIARHLGAQRLPLYRKRSVFIDWLNHAMESGLPESEAEELWRSRLGGAPAAGAVAAARAAQVMPGSADSGLGETWYLLSLVPLSLKRDRLVSMLLSSGILGEEEEARKRVYAPEDRYRDKRRGESAVFSRYVFFRGTPAQAHFANSFSSYAYVLKDRARQSFIQIGEAELKRLQVMLRDFPDAVELVDGRKWLEEHNARIVEGCKAVIRSGSLAGKEATVVSIKGRKSGKPTYFIEYVEGAIKFQSNLEGIQLDIVQE